MMPRGFTTLLQKENFSKNLQHVNRTKTMRPVKQTNPNTLKPYAGNAKKHSADQIDKIVASIKRFGFTAPVLIDEAGMILAGHGRSVAAVQMGLKKIPCIVIDGLSETEKAAYVIADNKLADYGVEWDEEMLAAEIAKLEAEDFDLSSLGFDQARIDAILATEEPDLSKEWSNSKMPDYDGSPEGYGTIIVHFTNPESRASFAKALDIKITDNVKFCWYPSKPQ